MENQSSAATTKPEFKLPNMTGVIWNDAHMQSTYANVSTVVAGREEVVVLLGMNQAWKAEEEQVKVDLLQRVVMSPFAAKRLAILLTGTLKAYEAKYGEIEIGMPVQTPTAK
jgi:hypothetical protein